MCPSGSYRPCPLGPPQVPSSFLPAPGAPAGPHLPCSSCPACAPRDSQLNVRGRRPGAASQRSACRRRPAGAACRLTSAWLDAEAAALLSWSRVRVSPQPNLAPFAEGHLLDCAPDHGFSERASHLAVHPTVGSSLVSRVRASCPSHVLFQTHRGPFFRVPEAAAGPIPDAPWTAAVRRDRRFFWTRPRRLALASPAAPSPGCGQANRGLSALILCLCLWGFYRFRLINSIRA